MKITMQQLKYNLKRNRVYAVIQDNSTNRVLKVKFYIINNQGSFLITGKTKSIYKSSAIGMDRVFDCYLKYLGDNWTYKEVDKLLYHWRNNSHYSQNYKILGE